MALSIKPNVRGIRELLLLPAVRADLERRAERVAEAANAATPSTGRPVSYEMRSDTGKHRVRAAVIAAGAVTNDYERKHRQLPRLIGHAR